MKIYLSLCLGLLFSLWLMFHTFTSTPNSILVSTNVYSDFGSSLPLMRFFPHGLNWPIQHPLFPGEPIRYHFLFYAPIGFLESIGFPLSYALNIPSALGFFSLIFLIYYLSRKFFSSSKVGIISVILFLFNSSLSFLDFFKKYSLFTLPQLSNFVSFRPWNSSQITAFWALNIYTNQRHLGFSFAVCLLLILITYSLQGRYLYLIGFIFGSLLLVNQAGFLISTVFIAYSLLIYPTIRKKVTISFIGFLPWLILYFQIFPQPTSPSIFLGFLADRPLSLYNFVKFWFYNYGLSLVLLIPAFFLSPSKSRFFILPSLGLFILGNVFKLSPDIINNHKLFNFVFIIFGLFIANFLVQIPKYLSFLIFPFLVLGGLIDIFPVINDRFINVSDQLKNQDIAYFQSLPKSSVVLNSTWFYHPASLAGLPIYNGYSYFTWSYGHDQTKRESQVVSLYNSDNLAFLCQQLAITPITHIEVSPSAEKFINVSVIFNQLSPDYFNRSTGLKVFSVSKICPNS